MTSTLSNDRDQYGDYVLLVERLNVLVNDIHPYIKHKGEWHQIKEVKNYYSDLVFITLNDNKISVSKNHSSLGNIILQILMYKEKQ